MNPERRAGAAHLNPAMCEAANARPVLSLNKVQLIGILDGKPLCRHIDGRHSVVGLVIVTTEPGAEARPDNACLGRTWHRVLILDETLARFAERDLDDGDLVSIEGELRTRKVRDALYEEHILTDVILPPMRGRLETYAAPASRDQKAF